MFSHDRKRAPWASAFTALAVGAALARHRMRRAAAEADRGGGDGGDANLAITFLPKNLGNPYFDTSNGGRRGGHRRSSAAPTPRSARPRPVPTSQVSFIQTAAQQGVGGLVVSANDPEAICDALNEARDAGVKVVTFDSDTNPDCRDLFINQATAEGIAKVAGRPDRRADRRRRSDRDPLGIRQRDEPERLDRADGGGPRREPPEHRARRDGLRRRRRPDLVRQDRGAAADLPRA